MVTKWIVVALTLISLGGCVVVPLGWGHHHGGHHGRGGHHSHQGHGHEDGHRR